MVLLVTLNHAACDPLLFAVTNKQLLPQNKSELFPICDHEIVWPAFCQTSALKAKPAKSPVCESWSRKSEQDDKWSFCLIAGTLCPANQERQ